MPPNLPDRSGEPEESTTEVTDFIRKFSENILFRRRVTVIIRDCNGGILFFGCIRDVFCLLWPLGQNLYRAVCFCGHWPKNMFMFGHEAHVFVCLGLSPKNELNGALLEYSFPFFSFPKHFGEHN